MKNWIKSLLSKKNESPEDSVISEELFTFPEQEEPIPYKQREERLEEILSRYHHGTGYSDGFEQHNPELKTNYRSELIADLRGYLKSKLKELHSEVCELQMFVKQKEELGSATLAELEKHLMILGHKRTQMEDELVAVEEGRGLAAKPILQYERGFAMGFQDWLESKKINERFNL